MAVELVVGIDFGTTYSGISWAANDERKEINLITDWPNPAGATRDSAKVPTTIAYKNGKPHTWGYSTRLKEESFRWIKILLDPSSKIKHVAEPVVTSAKLLGPLNKTAEDVAADYLRLLWTYFQDHIRRREGENWADKYELRAVLTVPAIWTAKAKDVTLRIAKQAGLPRNLMLVTEPEAAALAVLRDRGVSDHNLKVGDSFVVCDAGGGTVDLISYRIQALHPLQLVECAVGSGDLCGSIFLDNGFSRHIQMLTGEKEFFKIKEEYRKNMLQEFENGVKRAYDGGDTEYSVDLRGVQDNPNEGIVDETITIQPNVLKTVFDHIIDKIIKLIDDQIEEAEEREHSIKAILLVGGFGENKYLHKRVRDAHVDNGIQVLQSDGAWSSICRGATMWGLENKKEEKQRTVIERLARRHYGFWIATPFNESKHDVAHKYKHSDGSWRCDVMDWKLALGSAIKPGFTVEYAICSTLTALTPSSTGVIDFTQELHCCGEKTAPLRHDPTVELLCSVRFGIDAQKLLDKEIRKTKDDGGRYYNPTFHLKVKWGSAVIAFTVFYRGEQVAFTEADYFNPS